MQSASNNSAESLAAAARNAMESGRLEEAARLWQQVLALAPHNASALLYLGQHALMQKDLVRAHDFLILAAKAAPNNPSVPLNLAFVARARGDSIEEMNALTVALAIDPYFYPALLSKAMLLERMGQVRQAARVYKDVLAIAPSPLEVQSAMKGPLEHAKKIVEQNAAKLDAELEVSILNARSLHSSKQLARVEVCKQIVTGTRKAYSSQPSLLHFPMLPAVEFYDNADFPWVVQLEAATDVIRQEFIEVHRESGNDGFRPYIERAPGTPLNQWAELNRSPRWNALHLWRDGERSEHASRYPKTSAAISAIPMVEIPNFAPTVVFSALAPHTSIPPHTGSTNVRLVAHLPLIVPDGCWFRVGGETRFWEKGKVWIFDDTIEHEARNDSDETRVILMIDVWNPYLSEVEKEVVSALLNDVHNYYKSTSGNA